MTVVVESELGTEDVGAQFGNESLSAAWQVGGICWDDVIAGGTFLALPSGQQEDFLAVFSFQVQEIGRVQPAVHSFAVACDAAFHLRVLRSGFKYKLVQIVLNIIHEYASAGRTTI